MMQDRRVSSLVNQWQPPFCFANKRWAVPWLRRISIRRCLCSQDPTNQVCNKEKVKCEWIFGWNRLPGSSRLCSFVEALVSSAAFLYFYFIIRQTIFDLTQPREINISMYPTPLPIPLRVEIILQSQNFDKGTFVALAPELIFLGYC